MAVQRLVHLLWWHRQCRQAGRARTVLVFSKVDVMRHVVGGLGSHKVPFLQLLVFWFILARSLVSVAGCG